MLGITPIGVRSASKKLAARLRNNPLTTADILGSVIKRPKNKSFFRSISDSIELRFEILRRRWPGAKFGHIKNVFQEPLLATFKLTELTLFLSEKSSAPNNRQGKHACFQNLM